MSENKNITFEAAVKRLEEIVDLLERGNTSLDESLALYEEGVGLVRFCNDALDGAEKRIKVLAADGGNSDGGELSENA